MSIGKSFSVKNGFAQASSPQTPLDNNEIKKFEMRNKIKEFNDSFYDLEIPKDHYASNKINNYISNSSILTLREANNKEYIYNFTTPSGSQNGIITDRFGGYYCFKLSNNSTISLLNFMRSYYNNFIVNGNDVRNIDNLDELGLPEGMRPIGVIDDPKFLTSTDNSAIVFVENKHYFIYFNYDRFKFKKGPNIGNEGESIRYMLELNDKFFVYLYNNNNNTSRVVILNKDEGYTPTGQGYSIPQEITFDNLASNGKKIFATSNYGYKFFELDEIKYTEVTDKFANCDISFCSSACYIKFLDMIMLICKNDQKSEYKAVYFDKDYNTECLDNKVISDGFNIREDEGKIFIAKGSGYGIGTTSYANSMTYGRKRAKEYDNRLLNRVQLRTSTSGENSFNNGNAEIYGILNGNNPFDSLDIYKNANNIKEVIINIENLLDREISYHNVNKVINLATVNDNYGNFHNRTVTNLDTLTPISKIIINNHKVEAENNNNISFNTNDLRYYNLELRPTNEFYGDSLFLFNQEITRKIVFSGINKFDFLDKAKSTGKYAIIFRDIGEIIFKNVEVSNFDIAFKFENCSKVIFNNYTLNNTDKLFTATNSNIIIMNTVPVNFDKTNSIITQATA